MCFVNGGVSSINVISEQCVVEADGSVVAFNPPCRWIDLHGFQVVSGAIGGANGVDILCKLVNSVAAWRRAAHDDVEGRRGDTIKGGVDFCLVVHCVREAQLISDT